MLSGLPALSSLTSALLALAAVLALVLLTAKAAQRIGLGRHATTAPGSGQRLQLVETLALDPRRRAVLLRCGAQEWLVLTGGPQDVVVGAVHPAEDSGMA